MSMAINRISASGVAGMMYGMPVSKPSRVAKVDSGDRANVVAAGTSSQAVQGISGSQSDASGTSDQTQAAFQYARAGLSSVGTISSIASSNTEVQSGGVQGNGAYAQVEQQAGQVLDLTA